MLFTFVSGVNTFRNRQSSVVDAMPNGEAVCGQWFANCGAASVWNHGACGTGGRQRKLPTGAAAYGIPRNSRTPAELTVPRTSPLKVKVKGFAAACACESAGVQQNTTAAASINSTATLNWR